MVFRDSTRRTGDDSRRSQEPEIDFLQASPSTPHFDRFLVPSPSREGRSPLYPSTGSDAESVGRSTSNQSMRKSRMRATRTDEQSTSRLILDVIPHEIADEALKSAQNMSRSTLLEAKADETIDLLIRQCTYLDPEYFSEDERSSSLSTEPSISSIRNRNPQHPHNGKGLDSAEGSKRQRSDNTADCGPVEELDDRQSVSLEDDIQIPSSLPAGRSRDARGSSNPLPPTVQHIQGDREAKARSISHELSYRALQTPKEPSTPAPPYPSSQSGQCPSCSAAPFSGYKSCTDKRPCQPTGTQTADAESGSEANPSIDSAVKLFETRLLEIMKQASLPNANLDAQSRLVSEQQESRPQSVTIEQEAEPVILKDCLGRKFLFPIQKCKSWQVSPPKARS